MKKLGVLAVHLAAWLAALSGAALVALLWPSIGPAVDIQVRDTTFIIAHGNFSLIAAMFMAVLGIVAWRYHAIDVMARLAGAIFAMHLAAAVLMWAFQPSLATPGGGIVRILPSSLALGYLYLGSSLITAVVCVLGWTVSLARTLRRCTAMAT
jgi:hypothetical protein